MRAYRKNVSLKCAMLNSFVNVYTLQDSTSDSVSLKKVSGCCGHEIGHKDYCKKCQEVTTARTDVKGYWKGKGKAKQFAHLDASVVEKLNQFKNGIVVVNWVEFNKISLSNLGKTYVLETEEGEELIQLIKNKIAEGVVPVCKTILNTNPYFSILRIDRKSVV